MEALSEAVRWDFGHFGPPQPTGLMAHRWTAKVCGTVQVPGGYLSAQKVLSVDRTWKTGQTVKVLGIWCNNRPNKMFKHRFPL